MEPRHPEGASQCLGKGKVLCVCVWGGCTMAKWNDGGSEDWSPCTAQFPQMGLDPHPQRIWGRGSLKNERGDLQFRSQIGQRAGSCPAEMEWEQHMETR